jgi:hypothetical protein
MPKLVDVSTHMSRSKCWRCSRDRGDEGLLHKDGTPPAQAVQNCVGHMVTCKGTGRLGNEGAKGGEHVARVSVDEGNVLQGVKHRGHRLVRHNVERSHEKALDLVKGFEVLVLQ